MMLWYLLFGILESSFSFSNFSCLLRDCGPSCFERLDRAYRLDKITTKNTQHWRPHVHNFVSWGNLTVNASITTLKISGVEPTLKGLMIPSWRESRTTTMASLTYWVHNEYFIETLFCNAFNSTDNILCSQLKDKWFKKTLKRKSITLFVKLIPL